MRKVSPLLVLLFALFLSSCGSSSNTCSFSGLVPNATYLIVITSTSNGIPENFTRVASSSGTISVSTSASCSNVVAVQVVNSPGIGLNPDPGVIFLPNPPAKVIIAGQSFDTTYGMPRVEYFDGNGYLVGSVYASSVSGDGASLEANVPDLSSAYSGTYQIRVTNKAYEGYYTHIVGTASVTAWGRDRADSDGDGWYDDQDCAPDDPYMYTNCTEPDTCGGTPDTYVVVCN
jgi:hypothetical protein